MSTSCYFVTLGALDRHFLVLIHLIAGGRRKRQVVDGHHLHLDNATEDAFLHGNTHMNLIIYLGKGSKNKTVTLAYDYI